MISVVIPLYNKEKYIADTLNSVLSQTYQDFEIIVVDDGSLDNSLQVVKNVIDPRIVVITQFNSGVSVARNVGITNASNDYVAFLDADDSWDHDYLETIIMLIEKYPEAGAFATHYRVLEKSKTKKPKLIRESLKDSDCIVKNYFKLVTLGDHPFFTSSICVRKRVFDNVGLFVPGVRLGEDIDMWARIALHEKIAFCSSAKVSYNERTVGNAMTTNIWSNEWPFSQYIYKIGGGDNEYVSEYVAKVKLEAIALNLNFGSPAYAYTLINTIQTQLFTKRLLMFKTLLCLPVFGYRLLKYIKNLMKY